MGNEYHSLESTIDNDECTLETYRCHPHAYCNNILESYISTCDKGFIGNGAICEGMGIIRALLLACLKTEYCGLYYVRRR